MKKLISILSMVLLLSINSLAETIATDVDIESLIMELKSYGVIQEDFSVDELNLSVNVSRGEFAKMIAIIMGGRNYQPSGLKLFEDIETDNEYYPYIEYLLRSDVITNGKNIDHKVCAYKFRNNIDDADGLMYTIFEVQVEGVKQRKEMYLPIWQFSAEDLIVGDGEMICFYPDRDIIGAEVIKMTACAIGYGNIARMKGGYPTGYMSIFQKDSWGFSVDGAVTFREAIKWIYQIIDEILLYDPSTNPTEEFCFGSFNKPTLREVFLRNYTSMITADAR